MKRKLIFLDIDGTLVAALSAPAPRVIEAVRRVRENGHLAFLCTGRNLPSIVPDILEIGFDGVVASAGAYVSAGGQVLFDSLLPEELVQECLTVFHSRQIYCRIEDAKAVYTDPQMEELLRAVVPDPSNSELIRMQKELEGRLPVYRYEDYPRQGAYKLCFTSRTQEAIDGAKAVLGDRFDFVIHPFLKSAACINGEIIRKGVDKGTGMARLCRHFGAELEDSIAFGDSMNDEAMLKCAGISVAMGNACQELKSLADRTCEDVTNDGVYWELQRMGLL